MGWLDLFQYVPPFGSKEGRVIATLKGLELRSKVDQLLKSNTMPVYKIPDLRQKGVINLKKKTDENTNQLD